MVSIALLVVCLGLPLPVSANTIYFAGGGGMTTPETISVAPATFGSYGGTYFIPDFGARKIWTLPAAGGSPTMFASSGYVWGGFFTPSTFGAYGDQFLVSASSGGVNGLYAFDSSANRSLVYSDGIHNYTQGQLAPSSFGSYGGQAVFAEVNAIDYSTAVVAISAGGTRTPIAGMSNLGTAWGLTFSNDGTKLYVADFESGKIAVVLADGTVSLLTDIPQRQYEQGLRQIAMAPAGYPDVGGLLLVSIGASNGGGGVYGELVAVDPTTGAVVSSLRYGSATAKFDPRGIYFGANGKILVSDASDPIFLADSYDFLPGRDPDPAVPEPSSLVLAGVGLCALAVSRKFICKRPRKASC